MASDYAIVQEHLDRYHYNRDNGHLKYQNKAEKCEKFFYGDQWDDAVRRRLQSQRRPALTFNKVLPSCAAIFAEQLNNRADIGFKPLKGGSQEVAEALQKVFISLSQANGLRYIESEMFADGIITSRGFVDSRISFDDNIFGEVRLSLLNPRNVMIDPDAEEYDPKFWKEVMISKWLSLSDIENLYGKGVANDLRGRGGTSLSMGYDFIDTRPDTFGGEMRNYSDDVKDYQRCWRLIERQYREFQMKEHFVDLVTGDTRCVPEGMSPEKIQLILQEFQVSIIKRRTEVIKWVVTIDDQLVHNEVSPYKNLTVTPYFPFFRRGRTIGLVENMIDPQELYNKTKSQELHIVNSTANGGWKIKQNSLKNMDLEQLEQRGAETGIVLELDDTKSAEKISPNQVPTGMDRISFMAAEDLKEISMASDSMRGFDRADVAAKAIQQKQAQGSSNFMKPLDNLNLTRELLARNILDLIQAFYVEPRLVHITGNEPGSQDEEFGVNQPTPEGTIARDLTLGEYSVVVSNVPARETYQESQFQQAVSLRELGVAIPDSVLVENSHLERKAEIAQQLSGAMTEEQQMKQQQLEQLEMQKAQLEMQKLQADQKKTESEAALNLVRAQQAAMTDPNGKQQAKAGEGDEAALEKLALEKEQAIAELELKKYEIDQQIRLKEQELALKAREMQEKMQLERRKATLSLAASVTQRNQQQNSQKQEKPNAA